MYRWPPDTFRRRALKISQIASAQLIIVRILHSNARNELLFRKHIFVGTLNANLVHPREIFQEALNRNAASVILVHNHPSGDSEPSEDDLTITKRLAEAGKIMGIDILDHIIIAKTKVFSFKENKLI